MTALARQRLLQIQVAGLSAEDDPTGSASRHVLNSLFELASLYNIVGLDTHIPPLFTQRILLIEPDGRPFAAMIGSAVGNVEQLLPSQFSLQSSTQGNRSGYAGSQGRLKLAPVRQ